MRKIVVDDLMPMAPKEINFVIEYCKDYNAGLAAERAGYSRSYGTTLLQRPNIEKSIEIVMTKRLNLSHIDAEWLLMELVDNHVMARQQGELSASNTALKTIMAHKLVDAAATSKAEVHMSTADDLASRILDARLRAGAGADTSGGDEVSFL